MEEYEMACQHTLLSVMTLKIAATNETRLMDPNLPKTISCALIATQMDVLCCKLCYLAPDDVSAEEYKSGTDSGANHVEECAAKGNV